MIDHEDFGESLWGTMPKSSDELCKYKKIKEIIDKNRYAIPQAWFWEKKGLEKNPCSSCYQLYIYFSGEKTLTTNPR